MATLAFNELNESKAFSVQTAIWKYLKVSVISKESDINMKGKTKKTNAFRPSKREIYFVYFH